MTRRLRRAGASWRLLVHGRGDVARSYDVTSDVAAPAQHEKRKAWFAGKGHPDAYAGEPPIVLGRTEFDELVVGQWCHIEQMDTGFWWMNIGGVTVHVRADRDGRPKHVMVHGPDDYAGSVDGCAYECVWSGE